MSAADGHRTPLFDATDKRGIQRSDAYPLETIRQLNALTSDFYAREAASFSATRQAPWHGWEEAWNTVATHDSALAAPVHADSAYEGRFLSTTAPLAVLDLGCGNLRFERFLVERTNTPLHIIALDNCPELTALESGFPRRLTVDFQTLDLVESLLDSTFADRLPHDECDLAVAFGLMHHLPTFTLRAQVLEGLLDSLRPGGFAIVSFWQFLNDPRLAAKAAATTAEGRAAHRLPPFQENDFLLGWQHAEGTYRFCHHTSEAEIDALLAAMLLSFREIARFSADGKQGNLNRYVVLRRS